MLRTGKVTVNCAPHTSQMVGYHRVGRLLSRDVFQLSGQNTNQLTHDEILPLLTNTTPEY